MGGTSSFFIPILSSWANALCHVRPTEHGFTEIWEPQGDRTEGIWCSHCVPPRSPMVSYEIPWCVPQTIQISITLCPISIAQSFTL
jgi:hypothetical protein